MQRQMMVFVIIIGLVGLAAGQVRAEEKPASEQVTELIKQLADGDFQKREEATAELTKIGEPVLETLREALKESKDPEVRMRLKQIIAEIEGVMAVKDLVKNWSTPDGKDLWYHLKTDRGRTDCYIQSSTKEDKYQGENVLKMLDVITMTEPGRARMGTINMTSFCRKDKNLTPLYAKIEVNMDEIESENIEYKFENGKVAMIMKSPNGMRNNKEIPAQVMPPDTFLINSFFRYVTILPLKEGASFQPNMLGPDTHDFLMKFIVSCESKEEITIGKDKIPAYKFKFYPEKEQKHPAFLWVTEKHQLVKIAPGRSEEGEMFLISQEEAEKGLAELQEKAQKEKEAREKKQQEWKKVKPVPPPPPEGPNEGE